MKRFPLQTTHISFNMIDFHIIKNDGDFYKKRHDMVASQKWRTKHHVASVPVHFLLVPCFAISSDIIFKSCWRRNGKLGAENVVIENHLLQDWDNNWIHSVFRAERMRPSRGRRSAQSHVVLLSLRLCHWVLKVSFHVTTLCGGKKTTLKGEHTEYYF